MNKTDITTRLDDYLDKGYIENLHPEAFGEILEVLTDFISNGSEISKTNEKYLAWVCNAVMGSGKSTAIEVLLKYLADKRIKVPLLLVFAEKSLMKSIYNSVNQYARDKGNNFLIEYVDADNVHDVQHTLTKYQVICITQQRYRDLTLGYGNWNDYRYSKLGNDDFSVVKEYRLTIVDEMPIFFDSCIFDIASKNNGVEWFDLLAEESNLSPNEKQFGRALIVSLISFEMLKSEGKRDVTAPLLLNLNDSEMQKRFELILDKIKKTDSNNFEAMRHFKWFMKLLHEDMIGAIDCHERGTSIMCSNIIPYVTKSNILVLDGTADTTDFIYNGHFEFKRVRNYHKYKSRVRLNIRNINTTKRARSNKKSNVHEDIASDIISLREKHMSLFPLVSKDDIRSYTANKVITDKQQEIYNTAVDGDTLPINLLNTRGKEVLSSYNNLALLNLPIRNPNYYKLISIGLYGVDIILKQNETRQEKGNITWFKDSRAEKVYEGTLLAEMLQIIHRSSLRKIRDSSTVNIFIYTHLIGWGEKLQKVLQLSADKYCIKDVGDKYNFVSKCKEYAKTTYSFLYKRADNFNNPSFSAGEIIKEEAFKKFINENWKSDEYKGRIIEIFSERGIEIICELKRNNSEWKKYKLYDEVYEKLFEKK